jgi:large subunit ribosomal protein L23
MENLKTKYSNVLLRPRVTEKSSLLMESNVYAFEIDPSAGKKEVAAAVKAFYGLTPVKVAIVKNPAKKLNFRGKSGEKNGVKKAYVYLKKGDTIELS